MELLPVLKMGWLNGWLILALLCLTEGILFLAFPRPVVRRLWDRSGWSPKQQVYTIIGKLCGLGCLVLIVLTPLKISSPVLVIGMSLAALGLLGLVKALFDFKNTPLDKPVTHGLYRLSRHPQIVMSSVVILGACIAIGSWPALVLLMIARLFQHLGIVAEEEICLSMYGEPYQGYLKQVPRYFILF